MRKRASSAVCIFILSFLFAVIITGCTPAISIESDLFVDYDAVAKEVPFGTELSLDGLTVRVKRADGTFVTLPKGGEGYAVNNGGYDKEKPGTYTITVTYNDFPSVRFSMKVLEEEIIDETQNSDIVLTDIFVNRNAVKRLFMFGEEFSTQGLIISKVFSNGSKQELGANEPFEVISESYKPDEAGTYEITVRFTDGRKTLTDVYNVTVTPEIETRLVRITLGTDDVCKEFLFGEDFSSSGIAVQKWYSSDDVISTEYADISEYTVDSSGYEANALGRHSIVIKIKDSDVQESYLVEVIDYLHHIVASQTTTIFDLGQEFDTSGFSVYEYTASDIRTLGDPTEYTIDSSEYDNTQEGSYTITVYKNDNPDISGTYTVRVMDIPDLD